MGQSICLTLITNVKIAKYKNKSVTQTQAIEVINAEFPTDLSLFNLSACRIFNRSNKQL
jgi:hypothetical protein